MSDPYILASMSIIIVIALFSVIQSFTSMIRVKSLEKQLKALEEKHTSKLDVLVRVAAQHDIFINDVKKRAEEIEKANRFRRSR